MTNSEEIYEFNKIDAYNKLKEAINYITGKDREQDFKKFMILCKTSALQGNSHAQYILGIFFEEGILGLERYFETTINTDEKYYEMINPKTALKWYKKSARVLEVQVKINAKLPPLITFNIFLFIVSLLKFKISYIYK